MLSAVCTQFQGMLLRFAQTWFCGMFGDCCNGSFCNRRFVSALCYFLWQRMSALVKLQKLQPQQYRIRRCWCLAVWENLLLCRLRMTCSCISCTPLVHLFICTPHMCIHVCCVDFYLHAAYSCSESYGIVFMFDPRQPSGQAQGSFPQQQPQLLDWSPSMADFVWKWLKNELPTVLVCLPDVANQGNKVVKHRDPTPHSNRCNRTNSHSGLLALIDKSNAKDLSRLYNKGKLVFSVLDSQVLLVLNQCCLQFARKVFYLDLLRHDWVACLEIAMGGFVLAVCCWFLIVVSQKALAIVVVSRCSVPFWVWALPPWVWCGAAWLFHVLPSDFVAPLKGLDICIHHS